MALHVVIMAGGKGERLWPLSREGMPKQLLSFGSQQSLLRATVDRTAALTDKERIYIVTNTRISQAVRDQVPDVPAANILAEPVGRNTAPCIAYAAAVISLKDPDATMAVFPSDHIIKDAGRFIDAVRFGVGALEDHPELLITLGMIPDHPETGYGYISPGEALVQDRELVLHKVNSFHEKPDRQAAQRYIEGGYLWNAGMFLWRVDTILREFRQLMPGMYHDLMGLRSSMSTGTDEIASFYERVTPVSIDYAVMEKTASAAVIPAEFGWNDIGSWDALGNILPGDEKGNVLVGDVFTEKSSNSVVFSTSKKIVVMGVENLVVVEGDDAILVCPRDTSQGIGAIVRKVVT